MGQTELPNDSVWSITSKFDHEKDHVKKRNSKTTIIVCSLFVLGVTAALTVWVFAVRPNFYPHLKIMSRSNSEAASNAHHIKRRSDVDAAESEFYETEAEARSSIQKKKQKKNKKHSTVSRKQKIKKIFDEVEKEDFPYNSTRLPRNLLPSDYYISLDVDLGKDTYTGVVTIDLKCEKKTNFVIFHGRRIRIQDVRFASALRGGEVGVKKILFFKKNEMYLVEATKEFKKGKEYSMKIEFEADFNTCLAGFYKSKYRGKDGTFRFVKLSNLFHT